MLSPLRGVFALNRSPPFLVLKDPSGFAEGSGDDGVETIARIRFEHFQNGKGIKRIARELGIARDTVRKVLRSGATEFSYKREVQPQRKLGLWVAALTEILESEDKLPRRERRSTIRLFEELRGRGYDGAHM